MENNHKLIVIIVLLILTIYFLKTIPIEDMEEEAMVQSVEEKLTLEDPEFWIDKIQARDKVLMNSGEIEEFNKRNFQREESLINLEEQEPIIDKIYLISLIKNTSNIPNEERYDIQGNLMDKDFYDTLISNMNLDHMEDKISVHFGLTTERTNLRTFPTFQSSFKKREDYQFDRFMETAIYPWEPLVIYWESKDGEWYFGRMYNYIGWIPKEDVALGDKEEIFKLYNSSNFLVVVDRQIFIDNTLYDMGVRIPLIEEDDTSYKVLLPKRDEEGKLNFMEKRLVKSKGLYKGYLPYTKENILLQAFKLKDEVYGWGGMNNSRDCSAFIMDIHRSFGLKLPRNTMEQGKRNIGKIYDFPYIEGLDDRLERLKEIPPASILYMPGHTMLYLGEHEGKHYMIHQFSGYYKQVDDKMEYISVMRTAITPVDIKASYEKTYLDMVYLAKEFIP